MFGATASGAAAPEIIERSVRLELAAALRSTEYAAGVLIHRAEALLARDLPVGVFRRRLHDLVETVRADTIAERHERALTQRRVVVEEAGDSMAWLHVYGPAVEAHAAFDRATAIAKTVVDADRSLPDHVPGALRSLDQARTDVLFDLLIDGTVREHPAAARGIRATVITRSRAPACGG